MQNKKYQTANAFRKAIEDRLKNIRNEEHMPLERLRRSFAFDRFLCRLFKKYEGKLLLKGDYSMELRINTARATRDIDLLVDRRQFLSETENQNDNIREKLQKAASFDLGDFFLFTVSEPRLDLEAIPYGGVRYAIDAFMDNRIFVRFPIDIVIASLILEPIENLVGRDWLSFAGISQDVFPAISKEQQFAEKLHAYTFLREGVEYLRVKDLVDLILLIKSGKLKSDLQKTAIKKIFIHRATHKLPKELNPPPTNCEPKFNKLAEECKLTLSMEDGVNELKLFLGSLKIYTTS